MPLAFDCPILCYVTDRQSLSGGGSASALLARIRLVAGAGAGWIQFREKDLLGRELFGLAREAVKIARARIVINDRADVALASGAAGVHLGGASVPAIEAVRWVRQRAAEPRARGEFLVGVSCHSPEGAQAAEHAGANYVFFGPVFETPSKRAFGSSQGVARLKVVCQACRIPVLAIGGINEGNAAECLRAGAAGIAAIRMFQEPEPGALKELLARLRRESAASGASRTRRGA